MPAQTSFSSEGRPSVVELPGPDALGARYVRAMRHHERKAVLAHWAGGSWQETPDWRFDRQVIRLALFLKERAGLQRGGRIAILAALRPEWIVADFAATVQGAVAVAVDPELRDGDFTAALADAAPRVAFVAGSAALERLEAARLPGLETVIAFQAETRPQRAVLWSEALDLGGTLDTPERAQAFRETARQAAAPLVEPAPGGPPQAGDVAYVAGGTVTVAARLAIRSFVVDGFTTTALGTPGRELEEIAALQPHDIVAAPTVLAAALERARATAQPPRKRGWLRRNDRNDPMREAIRGALGGRVRRVRPTAELDPALSQALQGAVTIHRED